MGLNFIDDKTRWERLFSADCFLTIIHKKSDKEERQKLKKNLHAVRVSVNFDEKII